MAKETQVVQTLVHLLIIRRQWWLTLSFFLSEIANTKLNLD